MSLIHIDSTNRVSGTFSSFNVNIDPPKNNREYSTCKLVDAAIPQTWFNIAAAIGNNVFYYTEYLSGVTVQKSITFPDGMYSISIFINLYQSLMKANTGYTYSASFPYYLGYQTNSYYLIFDSPAVSSPTPYFSILWSKMPQLAKMLGFDPIDSTPTYNQETIGVRPYNMNDGLGYAYLYVEGLPTARTSSKQNLSMTFPIPLFGNSTIISGPMNQVCIEIPPGTFKNATYQVELRRRDGGLMVIQGDWQFTLHLC